MKSIEDIEERLLELESDEGNAAHYAKVSLFHLKSKTEYEIEEVIHNTINGGIRESITALAGMWLLDYKGAWKVFERYPFQFTFADIEKVQSIHYCQSGDRRHQRALPLINGKPRTHYRSYSIWRTMMNRLKGGAVDVCLQWRHFDKFFADVGEAPKNKRFMRKDSSKPYSLDNVEWK